MSSKLRQQDLPAEDLSDLGSHTPRGTGLSGLLDHTPAVAPRDPVPQGPVEGAEPVAEPAIAPRPPAAARTTRTSRQSSTRSRTRPTTAVYVSSGVKQRFEDYRHKNKKTNLQVVLEAITGKHAELSDIIKQSTVSTAPVGSLFPADPSAVRYLGGGNVQIGFSPTPEQEDVLDRLGQDLGFTTRSTWIAPVLNAFLPGRKDA